MKPLLDADIILYEAGFGCETAWRAKNNWEKGDPPLDPPPFDFVAELVDNKIADICLKVSASAPSLLFLTGKGNFRELIAKKKGYKENRKESIKPFHYKNIKAYLQTKYECRVIDGMEADDGMCIEQINNLGDAEGNPFHVYTIICSRDKDLKACSGWHYSWEVGNQPEFGPYYVNGYGWIELNEKKILKGVGEKFFYAQMLMGDPTDNIPGVPKLGAVGAFKMLTNTNTSEEGYEAVVEAYKGFYGDAWKGEMLEQGQLLWMIRELDENGKPVMWKLSLKDSEPEQKSEEISPEESLIESLMT